MADESNKNKGRKLCFLGVKDSLVYLQTFCSSFLFENQFGARFSRHVRQALKFKGSRLK
jgi:hypothetical protein